MTPTGFRLTFASALIFAAGLTAGACTRDDSASGVSDRLDRIEKQLGEIQTALKTQPRGARKRPQRPRPKPEVTYSIPVDHSPARGPADALVTVVEAFEFACPACESSRGVKKQVLEAFPKDVRLVSKNFIVHPTTATIPALAGCAAHEQGKFPGMAELIWEKGYKANRNLGADNMEKLAAEVGLDMAKFKSDMNSDKCKTRVREDQQLMRRVGVGGTPTFYVNGRHVQRRSFDQFKALIEEELTKAKERVAQGTKPAEYYKTWVVDKGTKSL